ncbi:MAG: phage tail sheath family protein [Clostridia bacterium]|nr:phage tail sheath family protein [Clostridia bacterium]
MGTFSVGETKIRPGEYHRFENAGGIETAGARNGIIAGVIRACWGPLNEVLTFDASTNVTTTYGSGLTEDLITEMFKGGNSTGYFVRVGSGGTAATVTLTDDATEAVDAVTLTAKYVGDRSFTVSVRDSISNTTKRECIIYSGTTEFEKVTFDKNAEGGEAAALVEAFADSDNFYATLVADGSGVLAGVTQQAFTAGTNPTVDSDAYSTALNALEPYAFNVLCVDTEDTAIHALVQTFIDRIYEAGSYPMAVLSETSDVAIATRMTNAAAYNDSKIIYVLNGGVSTSGVTYEGYLNAARIGGIVAAVPANQSVTHYVVSGYAELSEVLTNTQIETALQSGCIVLTTNSSGQVWIEQGINTLITPSGEEDNGWKKIRRVKTRFELMQRIGDTVDALIGKINNDTDGRAAVVAAGQSVIDTMIAEGKLDTGSEMAEDESNPAKGDSAWFIIAVDDIDSMEFIYLTYRFRFSAES